MPIISKIGSQSLKVRLVFLAIYAALIVGAISMIYPFALMVSGSFKSEADSAEITPLPRFWFDDLVLFQKYAESKHQVNYDTLQNAWGEEIRSWDSIPARPAENEETLDLFLDWRKTSECRWWELGHTTGGSLFPINARLFRERMYKRFNGDIDAYREEMGVPVKTWSAVTPPMPSPRRFPREKKGFYKAFYDFAQTRPVEDRIILNVDGMFRNTYIFRKYSPDIEEYNKTHGTNYDRLEDVLLTTRVPEAGLARKDWTEYVREEAPLEILRLSPLVALRYVEFLEQEQYVDIVEYNRKNGTDYAQFSEAMFSPTIPATVNGQIDWEAFVRNEDYCPIEMIEVYGSRQSFEEYVANVKEVPVATIRPLLMPIPEADYHDLIEKKGEWRWEFTARNYKHVIQYLFLHGRGFLNTVIYCALAIGLALLINPLAAYALSRYKPPHRYKILLFCIATMAFPTEVTMIPAFLLLKRFPLWSLLFTAVSFGVSIWLLSKYAKRIPELLQLTISLGLAILVGFWAVPAALGIGDISLLNTFAALVLPNMANGYLIFLLKGFFDSLPRELYEAADVDGAREWTKFWTITMSLSKPILAVIALHAFVLAYSQFMMALIIIPDQKMWTLMVWIFQLQSESHPAVVYASIVLAAIPTFTVFALCQSVIIRGIVVPVEK